jgi:hypothetical protein
MPAFATRGAASGDRDLPQNTDASRTIWRLKQHRGTFPNDRNPNRKGGKVAKQNEIANGTADLAAWGVLVEQFLLAWYALAGQGMCDALGGAEFRRVFAEYVSAGGAENPFEFIHESANRVPYER